MSTVIVTSILTSSIIIICLLLIAIENKRRQKELNALLLQFSKAGSENDLCFSSQELLPDDIIGLDGIKRKLLVLSKREPNHYFIVDLLQVSRCSLRKKYKNNQQPNTVFLTKKKETPRIVLQFECMNGYQSLDVLFYSVIHSSPGSLEEMEQKAKDWETMLFKLIKNNSKKTA